MTESPARDEAPVSASAEAEIAAPVETTWDVLTDIERWPDWNPDVKSVDLEGEVTTGSVFRWKAGPGTITSTVDRLERPNLIAWTGTTLGGLRAHHVWHLEERNGKTHVRTSESFLGLLARIFRRSLRKTLERSLGNGLRYLKAEAERQAGATR
jgi:uncharacterized protein YndB with AHSA1/START domain